MTRAFGAYRLPGSFAGLDSSAIWLTKDGKGYIDDPVMSNACDGCYRAFSITGNTRLDILLRASPQ